MCLCFSVCLQSFYLSVCRSLSVVLCLSVSGPVFLCPSLSVPLHRPHLSQEVPRSGQVLEPGPWTLVASDLICREKCPLPHARSSTLLPETSPANEEESRTTGCRPVAECTEIVRVVSEGGCGGNTLHNPAQATCREAGRAEEPAQMRTARMSPSIAKKVGSSTKVLYGFDLIAEYSSTISS